MSDAPIRVLLVDDSATIRSALKIMIRREPDMDVVGAAPNGQEAIKLVQTYHPDVILMDIEMPVMNGIEATRRIMESNPTPIIIFSSIAAEAAPATLEALDKGAVDFITKDSSATALDIGGLRAVLLDKIRQFAKKRMGGASSHSIVTSTFLRNRDRLEKYTEERRTGNRTPILNRSAPAPTTPDTSTRTGAERQRPAQSTQTRRLQRTRLPKGPARILAIGSSTGGPQALNTVLSHFPANMPLPVVIVQHMPTTFILPFAQRLDRECKALVKVAEQGEALSPGTVYIAPGDFHCRVRARGSALTVDLSARDLPGMLHKPSVDVLFKALAEEIRGEVIAAVLTGMGKDGAEGARMLADLGATILAQDEASSVVYGMPRAVAENGSADIILPLEEIGDALVELCVKSRGR